MKTHVLTRSILAITLLTSCDPLMAERLLSRMGEPSPRPSASPSDSTLDRPTTQPSGSEGVSQGSDVPKEEPVSKSTPDPSSASSSVPEADLLLSLDMETAPQDYSYQGSKVEQKGVSSHPRRTSGQRLVF